MLANRAVARRLRRHGLAGLDSTTWPLKSLKFCTADSMHYRLTHGNGDVRLRQPLGTARKNEGETLEHLLGM